REGPSESELAQAKTMLRAGFVRQIERIGGFGGKADVLAECAVFVGDAGCFRERLRQIETAKARDLRRAGRQWLGRGSHTLVVVPGERVPTPDDKPTAPHVEAPAIAAADPKYRTVASDVDRS